MSETTRLHEDLDVIITVFRKNEKTSGIYSIDDGDVDVLEGVRDIIHRYEVDIEYGGLIDALKVFIERGEELKVSEITDHLLMAIQALEWKQEKPPPLDDILIEMVDWYIKRGTNEKKFKQIRKLLLWIA